MSAIVERNWEGESGSFYRYRVCLLEMKPDPVPGNFIFAYPVGGAWLPVLIGQSDNLAEQLADQEQMRCARLGGATHLHLHEGIGDVEAQRREMTDLVRKWRPACNRD